MSAGDIHDEYGTSREYRAWISSDEEHQDHCNYHCDCGELSPRQKTSEPNKSDKGDKMNNSDERDYAEEEYNRRTMKEEYRSELRAESYVSANKANSVIFTQSGPYVTFVWSVQNNASDLFLARKETLDQSYIAIRTSVYMTRTSALEAIRNNMDILDEMGESYYLVDLDKI